MRPNSCEFGYIHSLVLRWNDIHAAAFAVEFYFAIDQCEERVVFALTDAFPGLELCAELAYEDVAGDNLFAAVSFDAAPLAIGIPTVAAGALTFFMCHGGSTFGAKPQAMEPPLQ